MVMMAIVTSDIFLFIFWSRTLDNKVFNLNFANNKKGTIWDLLSGIATLKALESGPCPFLLTARILKI